jgi:hypothetical protein
MRRIATLGGLAFLLAALITCLPAAADEIDFFERVVADDLDGARFAQVVDLDDDGDNDIVACGYEDADIFWWENNGLGSFTRQVVVQDNFAGANHLVVDDLDDDGDKDIVAVSFEMDVVAWWRNNGSETFTRTNIATGFVNASCCFVIDLDDDGDKDVLASAFYQDKISWFENDGSENFTMNNTFTAGLDGAQWVWAGDVDNDGDQDVAGLSFHDGNVTWWENNGSETFTGHQVSSTHEGASWIVGLDLDDDGDMDFVSTAFDDNRLTWWENNGSETFTQHNIDNNLAGAIQAAVSDLDNDGDKDIIATTFNGSQMYWYDNDGAENFTRRLVTDAAVRPYGVAAGDLDGDVDVDLVLCDFEGDALLWFESGGGSGGTIFLVAGPGPGPDNEARVKGFYINGSENGITDFIAYGAGGYGVNVVCGDLTGDGIDEIVTGAGPGAVYGPHVRAFNWNSTAMGSVSFLAYGTNKYGVNVTCGDVDGDGYDEIITGAGPGAVFGPHVRGWNFDGGPLTEIGAISYFAYGTPKWGVNVSCGDIDGDGIDEILTGAGPGAVYGPHVRGWNFDGSAIQAMSQVSFLSYSTNRWGVNVAAGDIDGDGYDEIITGAGPGEATSPHVRAFNFDNTALTPIPGVSFFAYETGYTYGVNVNCVDLDNDGYDEILTGAGPGPGQPTLIRGWNYDGAMLEMLSGTDFFAFDETTVFYGANVAGGAAQ